MVDEQDIYNCVKHNIQHGVKYVVLFANVGKMKKNDAFISSPRNPGNHWTLLYVDLTVNRWYHCDTFCWRMPEYLKSFVTPFVTAIYQLHGKTPMPVSGVQAHTESFGSSHFCVKKCLKNIPPKPAVFVEKLQQYLVKLLVLCLAYGKTFFQPKYWSSHQFEVATVLLQYYLQYYF